MTVQSEQLAGDRVLILDFGSQYTQLIARRVRELGIYAEIRPFRIERDEVLSFGAGADYLSGGPNSVTDEGAPTIGTWIYELGVPVLGICYGLTTVSCWADVFESPIIESMVQRRFVGSKTQVFSPV